MQKVVTESNLEAMEQRHTSVSKEPAVSIFREERGTFFL
jgi:hypothetical protein